MDYMRDSPTPSFLLGPINRGASTGDEKKGRKFSPGIYLSGFLPRGVTIGHPQPNLEFLFNSQFTQPSLSWVPETALYLYCFRRGKGKEPCCSCPGNLHHPVWVPPHPA